MDKPQSPKGIDPRKIDELSGPLKGLAKQMSSADEQNWPHSGPHPMGGIELLETLKRVSDGGVKGRWGYKKVQPPPARRDAEMPVDDQADSNFYTFFFDDPKDRFIFETWWLKRET